MIFVVYAGRWLLARLRCPGHVERWSSQQRWWRCGPGAECVCVTGSADPDSLCLTQSSGQRARGVSFCKRVLLLHHKKSCFCSTCGSDLTGVWHLLPPVQPLPGDPFTLLRSIFLTSLSAFPSLHWEYRPTKTPAFFVTSSFLSVEFWLHNLNADLKPVWLSVGKGISGRWNWSPCSVIFFSVSNVWGTSVSYLFCETLGTYPCFIFSHRCLV